MYGQIICVNWRVGSGVEKLVMHFVLLSGGRRHGGYGYDQSGHIDK